MIKTIKICMVLLAVAAPVCLAASEDALPAPGWDGAMPGQENPGDSQIAPENADEILKKVRRNFMSEATIRVHPLGDSTEPLAGFNVFIDDVLVGESPLGLKAFLVSKDAYRLSVEKPGWQEAVRPALAIPREGTINIGVIPENPSRHFTIPGFALGAAALVGSLVSYSQEDGETLGLGLLIGGVATMAITQLVARFVHRPAARRAVQKYNRRHLEP